MRTKSYYGGDKSPFWQGLVAYGRERRLNLTVLRKSHLIAIRYVDFSLFAATKRFMESLSVQFIVFILNNASAYYGKFSCGALNTISSFGEQLFLIISERNMILSEIFICFSGGDLIAALFFNATNAASVKSE